jgi:hypothetical protein
LAHSTRNYLDTGKQTAEALRDTPVKLAPLPARAPLAYGNHGLPAIAVILKWIKLNILDAEQRNESKPGKGVTPS